ncbi:WD40-repeat-containing domain protein, partial [Baffinella frigidus]
VKVLRLSTGDVVMNLAGHSDAVNAVAYSPDGKRIISGSSDHTIRIWDAFSGADLHVLTGHTDKVRALAICGVEGATLVSGGHDRVLRVWDLRTNEEVRALVADQQDHEDVITCVALSPDGTHVASGSHDKSVLVWDITPAGLEQTLSLRGHVIFVYAVAWSPDGRTIASLAGRALVVWDAATGALRYEMSAHSGPTRGLLFSASSEEIVTGGAGCNLIKIWNVASGEMVGSLMGHTSSPNALAMSCMVWRFGAQDIDGDLAGRPLPRGGIERVICSGATDGSVHVVSNGAVICSGATDGSVHVHSAGTGAHLYAIGNVGEMPKGAAISPDGRTLAVCTFGSRILLHNLATRTDICRDHEPSRGPIFDVQFLDNQTVAVVCITAGM